MSNGICLLGAFNGQKCAERPHVHWLNVLAGCVTSNLQPQGNMVNIQCLANVLFAVITSVSFCLCKQIKTNYNGVV